MLAELNTSLLATGLESLSDLHLLIDEQGLVIHASVSNPEAADLNPNRWLGELFINSLVPEHAERASEALDRANRQPGEAVRADLSHTLDSTGDFGMVSYRFLRDAESGHVIALGMDLRPISGLRQQLVNAQQSMERDYWSNRQIETRYRRLFDMASDGFLVVDDASGRIVEANPRARDMLSPAQSSIVGRPFPFGLTERSTDAVHAALAEARGLGHVDIEGVLEEGKHAVNLGLTFIRQTSESRFLIKLSGHTVAGSRETELFSELAHRSPDALLVLNDRGEILWGNHLLLEWMQVPTLEQLVGRPAEQWLGRSSVDISVLIKNLRQHGMVQLYSSVLKGQFGTSTDIEVSAIELAEGDAARFALFLRDISRRVTDQHPMMENLPRSIEQITGRVGRVPIKELVRESTDVIEALCIESALKLTKDNRASAAELLGLSRQSLYTKLRRYGVGDGGGDDS